MFYSSCYFLLSSNLITDAISFMKKLIQFSFVSFCTDDRSNFKRRSNTVFNTSLILTRWRRINTLERTHLIFLRHHVGGTFASSNRRAIHGMLLFYERPCKRTHASHCKSFSVTASRCNSKPLLLRIRRRTNSIAIGKWLISIFRCRGSIHPWNLQCYQWTPMVRINRFFIMFTISLPGFRYRWKPSWTIGAGITTSGTTIPDPRDNRCASLR